MCGECVLEKLHKEAILLIAPKGAKDVLMNDAGQAFSRFFGKKIKVVIREDKALTLETSSASDGRRKRAIVKKDREEELRNDPYVRKTLDLFGGTVQDVELVETEEE